MTYNVSPLYSFATTFAHGVAIINKITLFQTTQNIYVINSIRNEENCYETSHTG